MSANSYPTKQDNKQTLLTQSFCFQQIITSQYSKVEYIRHNPSCFVLYIYIYMQQIYSTKPKTYTIYTIPIPKSHQFIVSLLFFPSLRSTSQLVSYPAVLIHYFLYSLCISFRFLENKEDNAIKIHNVTVNELVINYEIIGLNVAIFLSRKSKLYEGCATIAGFLCLQSTLYT